MSPRLGSASSLRRGAPLAALSAGLVLAAPAAAAGPVLTTSSAVGTSIQARVIGTVQAGADGDTSYHVEYGPTLAYGSSTPDRQIPDPSPGTAGITVMPIDETIGGLSPSATYHLRLVATNSGGTSLGDDKTVNTLAQGSGDFSFVFYLQPGDRTWSRGDNWSMQQQGSPGRASGEHVTSLSVGNGDSVNDVTGVTTGKLALASSNLTGNAITLGNGGLTSAGDNSVLGLPVQLAADQTWTFGGNRFTASGGLSGAGALTFALALGEEARLTGANEIGDFTVGGSEPRAPLTLGAGSTLNAANGKLVTVAGATLVSEGASVGALRTGPAATVQIGRPTLHPSTSLAATSAALSPGATMKFELGSGFNTAAGTDYGQLSSSGPIDLAGATLEINHRAEPAGATPESCENAFDDVGVGTVYTLVSTSAALTGRFANAPDGATFADSCGADTGRYTIHYTSNAVTATVASPLLVTNDLPFFSAFPTYKGPQITGLNGAGGVTVGVPATAVHAEWLERTSRPTSKQNPAGVQATRPVPLISAPQWEDCGPVGAGTACVPIPGETGMTFTPRPTDVGRNIRFSETATSSVGVSRSVSIQNVVSVYGAPVVLPPLGIPGAGSLPPGGLESAAAAAVSKLGPPSKETTIRSLLKSGRVELSCAVPLPGEVVVQWYLVPAGAKVTAARAGKPKPKPLLVATGSQDVMGGPTAIVVKLTPAGKKKLKAAKKPLSLTSKASYTPTGAKVATKITSFKLKR